MTAYYYFFILAPFGCFVFQSNDSGEANTQPLKNLNLVVPLRQGCGMVLLCICAWLESHQDKGKGQSINPMDSTQSNIHCKEMTFVRYIWI